MQISVMQIASLPISHRSPDFFKKMQNLGSMVAVLSANLCSFYSIHSLKAVIFTELK